MALKQRIDLEICVECGACVPECPEAAISEEAPFIINPEVCTNCGACPAVCPVEAISEYDYTPPEPPTPIPAGPILSVGITLKD
jgi:ferredoxin